MNSDNKIIYDFGANKGTNLPYYLKKADIVVAVEANPSLCQEIRERFATEIAAGRLFVENYVLTADDSSAEVFFYICRLHHVLSQFPQPKQEDMKHFDKVLLPSKSVLSVIEAYGTPYYIKIDVEHYDEVILKTLFVNNIRPPFISAESHTIAIFALLVGLGEYTAFKLVAGPTVESDYRHHSIAVASGSETYSFPHHSAGPFGDDIPGQWLADNRFFELLAMEGLGWKDIHATNTIAADARARSRRSIAKTARLFVRLFVKPYVPKALWDPLRKRYRRLV